MEFAKRMLKKQGWTEGSGLGKKEDGRPDAIKATLKMDKAGMGHDPGKEFTDHWWLRVFNEAAQKVGKKDQVSETQQSEEAARKKKKAEQKKALYRGFVQGSTLTNGVEESIDKEDSSDDDQEKANATYVPTLEDIHKYCGGATGHKAARHGIAMEGKLDRVSKHERRYEKELKKRLQIDDVNDKNQDSANKQTEPEPKKKKKKRKRENPEEKRAEIAKPEEQPTVNRKKRRRKRDEESDSKETNQYEQPSLQEYAEEHEAKKPKTKRKKDKKKKLTEFEEISGAVSEDLKPENNIEFSEHFSKKRKKKNKNIECETLTDKPISQLEEADKEPKKKKKKSKKSKS